MNTEMSIILTTVNGETAATDMATMLIENKLTACIQEVNIKSHYKWEGEVQHDAEVLLLIKTASTRIDDVITAIKEHHAYDLPEIIVVPVVSGLPAYINWVYDETVKKKPVT